MHGPEPGPPVTPSPSSRDERSAATSLVEEAVDVFDSLVSYLADIVRLQGFRIQTEVRAYFLRALVFAMAGVIGILGLVIFSLGVAAWIAKMLGSVAGGLLIVGAVYLVTGAIVCLLARRGSFGSSTRQGSSPRDGPTAGASP